MLKGKRGSVFHAELLEVGHLLLLLNVRHPSVGEELVELHDPLGSDGGVVIVVAEVEEEPDLLLNQAGDDHMHLMQPEQDLGESGCFETTWYGGG